MPASFSDDLAQKLGQFAAGVVSGALSSVVTAPITILQARVSVGEETVRSPADFVKKAASIVQEEGLGKLYEGCGPQVLGSALSWGLFHPIVSYTKNAFRTMERTLYNDPSRPLSHYSRFLATCIAGAATNTLMNPVLLVRTRLQIQRRHHKGAYTSSVDCFRRVVREEGPLALFRGLTMYQLASLGPAFRYTMYDAGIERLVREGHATRGRRLALNTGTTLASVWLFYPFTVVRTRMRNDHSSQPAWQHISDVYQEFGARGFYRGFWLHFVRNVPSSVINLHLYDKFEDRWTRGSRGRKVR
ncbi:Mitochondrial folate transporter-like [Carpediemonas membranifera]|uniref:Mitochondrial folate transporter-like n=1 Tax=Carpediemonas membranifera TaxID=201153 RepID=A0A8J6E179_9EUKA|nr:Mitochondrial folate transporter-like [Carpediemonas membranifera]|eukprot:KAG9392741.1 Mitochondrial folate transporter-like [Carpediemonas membranifera]